jgi:zeaxanthin glucosyltransferase
MKVGFVSIPVSRHLNPMSALARKLQSRGNEMIFIGVPDAEPGVRAANLNFAPFCEKEYPVGSVAKRWGGVAKLHGLDVVEYTSRELIPGLIKAAFEHLPEKLRERGIKALVIDTVYRFLELVPMRLGMPYVQIWNVLPLDRSGSTPAYYFSWPHETTPEALARNIEGLKSISVFSLGFWRLRSLTRKRMDYRSTGTIVPQPFPN